MVSKAVNSWKVKTEKAKARIKSKATDYVRRQVKKIYLAALKVSPRNVFEPWSPHRGGHNRTRRGSGKYIT